jgi:ankyrin repeat protein
MEYSGRLQNTPLLWAAFYGHLDIVEYLIEAGANLDAVNAKGQTAIQIAMSRGNILVKNALLAAGARLYSN